jgi:hypothetical protein
MLSNLITRREIHTKQGRRLGGPEALELPPLSPSLIAPEPARAGLVEVPV